MAPRRGWRTCKFTCNSARKPAILSTKSKLHAHVTKLHVSNSLSLKRESYMFFLYIYRTCNRTDVRFSVSVSGGRMDYLKHLTRRGISASLTPDGALILTPDEKLTGKIREVANQHTEEIIAEVVDAYRQTQVAWAETEERVVLDKLGAGHITQDNAEKCLRYIFRHTAAMPVQHQPCPKCGETLHWRYPNEEGLPLLCYTCRTPEESDIRLFDALGGDPPPKAQPENLAHTAGWL